MTLQDLKNNRNEIISFIVAEVGEENVKSVMERMVDFLYWSIDSDVISYTRRTINDMSLIKKMESKDSFNVKKRAELTANGTIAEKSEIEYRMSHN